MATLDALLSRPIELETLIVDGERRWSPAEVEERAARLAGGLRAEGVQRGDFVTWQAANRAEVLLACRAAWRLGAVAVPLHHLAGAAEVEAMLAALSGRRHRIDLDELPDGPPIEPDTGAAREDDLATVLFTSGSSGTPKGVMHRHGALAAKARRLVEVHRLAPTDATLMPAPLAHISGLLNGILMPGAVPMKSVVMARWTPAAALDLIERERITFMVGPPTFFIGLMHDSAFSPERVASLRLVSCGGAGVTPAFIDEARVRLGAVVKRTYGSTEAPTVTTAHAGDDERKARDTDGRPTGDVAVRVDPDTGELQLKGAELFAGYTDPAATSEAFTDDGWFRTGDIGIIDAEGWLTVTGRLKDVIIRGGENISISAVEAVLEAHPAIRHAVALGFPDERLGERVAAVVELNDGAAAPDLAAIGEWFATQGVARFTTPERLVVVDALPLLAAGKPDRIALRALLAAGPPDA